MKERKKQSRCLRKIFASLLVLTLVAATMLYPDAMHPGGEAYATESEQVTLTSALEIKDNTTTDKVAFTISVGANATEGVSGIQFEVSYPKEFDLVSYTSGNFFDKGVSFFGETTETEDGVITYAARPFFCGVGCHKDDSGENAEKVMSESGDLVTLVFEANTTLVTGTSYSFGLADGATEAFLLAADDASNPGTTYYNVVTSDVAKTYKPVSIDQGGTPAEVSGETVKVTPTTSGASGTTTATVKKQAVEQAIEKAKTDTSKTEVVIDAGTDSGGTAATEAKSELTLAKESMAAVAEAEKSIQIKTDAGQLTFDKAAAASIGKADGGEKLVISTSKENIAIATEASTSNAVKFTVTAKLVKSNATASDEGKLVTSFDGGTVTVALDVPEGMISTEGDPIACWNYDLQNKNYTPMDGTVSDGKFIFTTTHFSDYLMAKKSDLEAYAKANNLNQGVTVSGTVTSYNPKNEVTVKLCEPGKTDAKYTATVGETSATSGQVTQNFSFANVPAGTYDLVVTKAAHLTYTIKNVVVGSTALDLTTLTDKAYSNITLLCGDIDGDNWINFADYQELLKSTNYGKKLSESGVNAEADLDGDGWINFADYQILLNSQHYGKSAVSVDFE